MQTHPDHALLRRRNEDTPSSLEIRPAREDDKEQVAAFIRSTAEWYRPFLSAKDMAEHAVDAQWAERNFALRQFYVGSTEGKSVGTISMQYFGDFAYLGYIYLDADQVGKGYGHRLMEFAAQTAERRGMRGMALIAHPKASWATRAYLKFGFKKFASHRDDVLSWNEGRLVPYYEEGFELYLYRFRARLQSVAARAAEVKDG